MSKTAIKRLRTYPEMYPEIVYWTQHNENRGNVLLSVLIDEMRLSKFTVSPISVSTVVQNLSVRIGDLLDFRNRDLFGERLLPVKAS